jgi:energy-coupling factor transporter ATP-binding protein EcfA2
VRLIRDIEIRNFRSLRNASLEDVGAYVPIVGLNGSGKSNLLRALSLFFNGDVEPGMTLDMKRDHYDPGRRFGNQRRVSVTVTFDLRGSSPGRKQVSDLFEKLGITETVQIERAWTYADPSGTLVREQYQISDGGPLTPVAEEDLVALGVFVRSVRLRYIPNHVRPADLINAELQALRGAIGKRVRRRTAYRTGNVQDAVSDLGAVANEMIQAVSTRIVEHSPELAAVEPMLPSDFADLVFQLGVETVSSSGLRQPPDMQGSGTQSYLLFHLLDLIDKASFEGNYGWTKGVVLARRPPQPAV